MLESRVFGNTATPVAEPVEDDVEEEEEEVPLERTEVVLIEKVQDDGAVARIIFTSGGEVDVYELEKLCDKVGKHSSGWSFRLVWAGRNLLERC